MLVTQIRQVKWRKHVSNTTLLCKRFMQIAVYPRQESRNM